MSRTRFAAMIAAGLLAGCAVGPDFHPAAAPFVHGYGATPAPAAVGGAVGGGVAGGGGPRDGRQDLVSGGAPAAQWWRGFGSAELDDLMSAALAHNADLAAASAALRQARETYLAQRGALLPSVELAAQAQRARNPQSLSFPLSSSAATTYNLFSGQLNVGYSFDLFGGVRRATEAARAQADQQRFQSEAAYLALTSNLANAFVQLAVLREQLRLTEELADADAQLVALTRAQHASGQVSGIELAAAEGQLAQARNAVPGLRKQIAQQVDLMAALCGRTPEELGAPRARLSDLRLPAQLPLSLPAQMVRQRPDVRAAEAAVHAASAQLGVAIANRLPNLTLSAALGGAAPQLGAVLTPANQLWSVTGALAQPIFQGGALLHRQRAARAALDEAQAQYRSAVLAGFQNVADVLAAVQTDAQALQTEAAAERAARRQAELSGLQHRYGQVSGLAELSARATALQASLARVQGEGARLTDSIALQVALGGGWWARSDFPQTRTTESAS